MKVYLIYHTFSDYEASGIVEVLKAFAYQEDAEKYLAKLKAQKPDKDILKQFEKWNVPISAINFQQEAIKWWQENYPEVLIADYGWPKYTQSDDFEMEEKELE